MTYTAVAARDTQPARRRNENHYLAANPQRERTITKLAVLKAASQFAASRPDCKSADVVAIADRWLAWVEAGR